MGREYEELSQEPGGGRSFQPQGGREETAGPQPNGLEWRGAAARRRWPLRSLDPRVSREVPRHFAQGIFAPLPAGAGKEDLLAPEHSAAAPRAASLRLKASRKGKTT